MTRLLMASLITLTNHPGAPLLPCGMTSHSNRRVGVQNAVRGIVSTVNQIMSWYPLSPLLLRRRYSSKKRNNRPLAQSPSEWSILS